MMLHEIITQPCGYVLFSMMAYLGGNLLGLKLDAKTRLMGSVGCPICGREVQYVI
jgi:hypothetical protein